MRRHGKLEVLEEQNSIKQLMGTARENLGMGQGQGPRTTEAEEKIRERAGRGKGGEV